MTDEIFSLKGRSVLVSGASSGVGLRVSQTRSTSQNEHAS